jgi:predicted kinase
VNVVILIGLQASGKTTFYRQRLAADHVHVSKDNFGRARHRQRRQLRLIDEALAAGRDVAVDNTNPSPVEWQPIIGVARGHGARVAGYWFPPDPAASRLRNAARDDQMRVPEVGIRATLARLRRPCLADGFDALHVVEFDGRGGFTIQPLIEEGR